MLTQYRPRGGFGWVPEVEYSFSFTTGSKLGAGTDALVSVQLEGECGSSGPMKMDADRTGRHDSRLFYPHLRSFYSVNWKKRTAQN